MSNDVNFKKLDELEVIGQVGEEMYLLVEDNGEAKRLYVGKFDDSGSGDVCGLEIVVSFYQVENNRALECNVTFDQIKEAWLNNRIGMVTMNYHEQGLDSPVQYSELAWMEPRNDALGTGLSVMSQYTEQPCFELNGPAWGAGFWIEADGPKYMWFD